MPEDFKMGNGMLFAKYWDFIDTWKLISGEFYSVVAACFAGPIKSGFVFFWVSPSLSYFSITLYWWK